MAHHSKILNDFKRVLNEFNFENKEHRKIVSNSFHLHCYVNTKCKP